MGNIVYYKGTLEEMNAVDAKISLNCNWPVGGTTRWAVPRETIDSGIYAIPVPTGSHGFDKAAMTNGVDEMEVQMVNFPIVDEG